MRQLQGSDIWRMQGLRDFKKHLSFRSHRERLHMVSTAKEAAVICTKHICPKYSHQGFEARSSYWVRKLDIVQRLCSRIYLSGCCISPWS